MLIDSHCHLDFPDLADDSRHRRPRPRGRGRAHGHDLDPCQALRRSHRHRGAISTTCCCSVGTHPHHAHEELDIAADELVRLREHPKWWRSARPGSTIIYDNARGRAGAGLPQSHRGRARDRPAAGHPFARADDDMARILEEETGQGASRSCCIASPAGRDAGRAGRSRSASTSRSPAS